MATDDAARFVVEMLCTNKHVDNIATLPTVDDPELSLKITQGYLLTNAGLGASRSQYFTPEMLELFANNPALEPGQKIIPNIVVKNHLGETTTITLDNIHPNAMVLYLHKLILNKTGIPIHHQRLCFGIGNHHYFCTVAECALSRVELWGRLLAGPSSPRSALGLPTHLLDDTYHSDLTNVIDDGRIFRRGGAIYNRPYGWKSFALNFQGTNIWLNGTSPRPEETSSADGEWPVSYHGTSHYNGLTIAAEGYQVLMRKEVEFPLGHGFFSTPDIHLAQRFAQKFTLDGGDDYQALVKNRVNPKNLTKFKNGTGEVFYFSPNEEDIRPYGFCVRKI